VPVWSDLEPFDLIDAYIQMC